MATTNNMTFLLLLLLLSLAVSTLGFQLSCYACTGYNPGAEDNELFNNKHCSSDNFDPEYVASQLTNPQDAAPQCFSITVHGEPSITRRYAVPRLFTLSMLLEYFTNTTTTTSHVLPSNPSLLLSLLQPNLNLTDTTSHALHSNPSLLLPFQQDLKAPRSNVRVDGYLCDTDLCNASPHATTTFCCPSFGLLLLLVLFILN
ncbi:hypothetical protein Pcinc_015789 [Petrolisthes cinctipes]|uniref:Uncharacterized protein n=1 Tax=Petrolisthes cinctipes TaxID=88211 RepID=A0AAE1FSL2_PETCI|nr:hypothetical protein Pcinc_015789 [Petrolisthes cinctipes]